jgi:hypothetical protein
MNTTNPEMVPPRENDQVRLRPENEKNLPKEATDGTVIATVERIEKIDEVTCFRVYWPLGAGLRCYSSIDASAIIEVIHPAMTAEKLSDGSAEPLPQQDARPAHGSGQKGMLMTAQLATNARRYDLDDEQVMPPPLNIDLPPEECEYVGDRSQKEIIDILQDGASLSLYVTQDEYCIEWKGEKFVFEVWHLEATRGYVQAYNPLELLLQSEGSRPSFDLSAFELIG